MEPFTTFGGWLSLVALVLGPLLVGRLRRLAPPSSTPHAQRVAVVIPARNERLSLPHLLDDLASLASDPRYDVIVVDDHSTDGTGDLARARAGVTVIQPPALPAGWRGKTWACHMGAEIAIARGAEVLVFLDADVRVAPGGLDAVVAERAAVGGVLSVQPDHQVPTAVEQLSAPFNVVSMMGIGAGTDHPTALTGPLICCTVADHRAVDGHRSVRDSVIEDVALGQRIVAAGIPMRVVAGGRLVRFRMYPTGLAGLWEGWTKNMAAGATAVATWRSIGVALWIAGMVSAAAALLSAGDEAATTVAVLAAIYVANAVTFGLLIRRVGGFRWWTWLAYPLPLAFFCLVFLRSLWATYVRRSVTWKGRQLDLRHVHLGVTADEPHPAGGAATKSST